MAEAKKIRVTLIRSTAGRLKQHRDNVHGLGLRKTWDSREVLATPENLGMVHKSAFMLKVEDI